MNVNRDNQKRVHQLREFAAGSRVVPILVQRDPDPDGMASALGIRMLLHRTDDAAPIISLGEVTRPENQRMAELLDLRVVRVTEAELNGFERVIAVDMQPQPAAAQTRFAVIDHHPVRDDYSADLLDIRPHYGAAATIVTEYLRADDERKIPPRLATALVYGIRTDTEVLRRGTSPADIEAYAFLQARCDQELLRRIGRMAFSERGVRAVGDALATLRKRDDAAVAWLGKLDGRSAHMLPSLADFCLSIEGVTWSAAGGIVGDEVVINLRHIGRGVGAGALARALAEREGAGGGHRWMARVTLAREGLKVSEEPGDPGTTEWLLARVLEGLDSLRALR